MPLISPSGTFLDIKPFLKNIFPFTILLDNNNIIFYLAIEIKKELQMKEPRKNETFAMKPTIKITLLKLCNKYDISQAKMLERLIVEKAKKVKLYEVAQ